jgi:cytochrome c551/c552
MFRSRKLLLGILMAATSMVTAAHAASPETKYPGIGRAATSKEIAAWDIDVRPDFKGLPVGSGSVAKGQDIWEARCAGCHGVFGESNEVFAPLIGGTTADDVKTGRVASLRDASYPGRTMFMKVASLSTVWDYINRAMPWNAPKSLSADEVFSVTAFLLNLAGIVPDDFVLSDKNIAEAQGRLPNRNGMTTKHAMWPGSEFGGMNKPDVQGKSCMTNCATEPKVASQLPAFARNAHGNLADQNREFGEQRGANTTVAESSTLRLAALPSKPAPAKSTDSARETKLVSSLLQKYSCTACHAQSSKLVGPAFADIAKKHAGKAEDIAVKIKSGGSGVWGAIPMPPQTLSDAEAKTIANWLAAGANKE